MSRGSGAKVQEGSFEDALKIHRKGKLKVFENRLRAEKSTKNRALHENVLFDGFSRSLSQSSRDDEGTAGHNLVKTKAFSGLTRAIALDCEFVGVGYQGKDNALARVSIVNQFGHVLMDEYVRPREEVVDYRTEVSGITPHHMRSDGPAKPFDKVQDHVAKLCKGRILVGHAIHNDLRVLMLSHSKKDIRDTSRYRPFKDLFKGRNPSLKALTRRLLGVDVQSGEHDSVEDARATMRIYTIVKRVWEAQIKARQAGKPFREIQRLAEHLNLPKAMNDTSETIACRRSGFTNIAKIALDINSEFHSGTLNDVTIRKEMSTDVTMKTIRTVGHVNKNRSEHRRRFLEKRQRIRSRDGLNTARNFS